MKIFRKRYIPNELVDISSDEVIYRDDKVLMTRWKPIRPRDDVGRGISCVFFEKGIKVSKVWDKNDNFKYWYCDVIDYSYDAEKDEYVIIDLLLDVLIYEDGHYKVLDEDELREALALSLIDETIFQDSIRKKDKLIADIENGKWEEYIKFEKILL